MINYKHPRRTVNVNHPRRAPQSLSAAVPEGSVRLQRGQSIFIGWVH